MSDSLSTWRLGNVVEGPSNLSRKEVQLLETNKKLQSKVRALSTKTTNYPKDVVAMAAQKARSK